jgi:hypothetical protein
MAKGGLNQMDWSAVVQSVRSMRVAQPMWAYSARDADLPGGLAQNHSDAPAIQPPPGPGTNYRLLRACHTSQVNQLRP